MKPTARIEQLVGRADGTHYRWRCCVGLEPCASGPWLDDESAARRGADDHARWHADEERRAAEAEAEYELDAEEAA